MKNESGFPECPICEEEVLIPFSVSQMETAKTFANWICMNCGFCIGTGDSPGYNPTRDIEVKFVTEIVDRIKELRVAYKRRGLR